MEYAKSLIKRKAGNTDEVGDDIEESWTFIGDDTDPELVNRIHGWEPRGIPGYPKEKAEHQQPCAQSTTPMPLGETMGSR